MRCYSFGNHKITLITVSSNAIHNPGSGISNLIYIRFWNYYDQTLKPFLIPFYLIYIFGYFWIRFSFYGQASWCFRFFVSKIIWLKYVLIFLKDYPCRSNIYGLKACTNTRNLRELIGCCLRDYVKSTLANTVTTLLCVYSKQAKWQVVNVFRLREYAYHVTDHIF